MSRNDQPAKPEQLELPFGTRYLNVQQVADMLGVPKSFIYRRTARGHGDPIPHYRLGGHLRFKLEDIEGWMEAHRNEPEVESAASLVAALREKSSARVTKSVRRASKPRMAT